jgi:hypothetical protein
MYPAEQLEQFAILKAPRRALKVPIGQSLGSVLYKQYDPAEQGDGKLVGHMLPAGQLSQSAWLRPPVEVRIVIVEQLVVVTAPAGQ